MSYSCPLTFEQVDSNVSRLNSLFVSSLVIAYLVSLNAFLLYFLALDFSLRLFISKGSSPLYMFSLFFKEMFNMQEKFTDGGAKRLAAYFGLLFVLMLIVTHLFDLWILSLVVAVIFLSCSILDAFFNFCLGCQIYHIIKKIYPAFMQ